MYVRVRGRIELQRYDAKSSRIMPFAKALYPFVLRTGKSRRARSLTLRCRSEKRAAFPYARNAWRQKHGKKMPAVRHVGEMQRMKSSDDDCSRERDREFRVILSRFHSNRIFI